MSCRETSGNSATTSLVKFLTGASEKIVSHEFHNLRREGRTAVFADNHDDPAPAERVRSFLEEHRQLALDDSRVKESRRLSLQERFDQAMHDLDHGRGPNNATFYAWTKLESAVVTANETADSEVDGADDQTGITPEGLEINYGDVLASRRMAEEAHRNLSLKLQVEPGLTVPNSVRYNRKKQAVYVAELQEKADRLQAAFDATDVGFAKLQAECDSSEPASSILHQRLHKANELRERTGVITQARSQAQASTFDQIATQKQEAASRVRHYESLVRAGKQNASNNIKLQEATRELKLTQRAYLYKVANEYRLEAKASSSALHTPSEWTSVSKSASGIDRSDIWRSLELLSADLDRARIRVGRISSTEAERRSLKRAQARQAILDAENNDELDPVNKRFAELEQRKRSIPQRSVG